MNVVNEAKAKMQKFMEKLDKLQIARIKLKIFSNPYKEDY